MPSEIETIDKWIYQTLSADAALTAIVGNRIYTELAPQLVDQPMVIYHQQSPSTDLMEVGQRRVWTQGRWMVKLVGRTQSFVDLYSAFDRIETLLHRADGVVGSGNVLAVTREQIVKYVELSDGIQWRHFGGIYNIIAQ